MNYATMAYRALVVLTAICVGLLYTPYTFAEDGSGSSGYGGRGGTSVSTPSTSGQYGYGGGSNNTSGQDQSSGGTTSDQGSSGTPGGEGSGSGSSKKPTTPGGGEETVVGNNLSFPVVTADGFSIPLLDTFSWEQVYDGPYTGLSDEERQVVETGSWYAQKTEGNAWQADFIVNDDTTLPVYGVDWGDIVEAVHPVVGRPFRLEVTLYHQLQEPLRGFTMAVLAFPSSPNETQGTNKERYENDYATIVSPKYAMVIQKLGDADPENLEWNGSAWEVDGTELPKDPLSFGPELNVGGKYIYGASKGGWRPGEPGAYRLTFYLPESDISLSDAIVGNYADWIAEAVVTEGEDDDGESHAATPVIDREHNLTYADVTVVTQREGMKPENPGGGEESESTDTSSTLTSSAIIPTSVPVVSTTLTCEPYLSDYLGIGLENDADQVVRLQSFLNDVLGTNIPLTGYFGTMTFDAVKLFQETFAEEILQPWIDTGHDVSLEEGTGYVYVTTLATINEMHCAS